MDALALAALFISVLALLLSVSSFWWLYARQGRARLAGPPRSFALAVTPQTGLLLTLPLALYNDGPTPIALINLELTSADPAYRGEFIATHAELVQAAHPRR